MFVRGEQEPANRLSGKIWHPGCHRGSRTSSMWILHLCGLASNSTISTPIEVDPLIAMLWNFDLMPFSHWHIRPVLEERTDFPQSISALTQTSELLFHLGRNNRIRSAVHGFFFLGATAASLPRKRIRSTDTATLSFPLITRDDIAQRC